MVVDPSLAAVRQEVTDQIDAANTRATDSVNDTTAFLGALRDAALAGAPATGLTLPGNISISVPAIAAVSPPRPTSAINEIKAGIGIPPESFESVDVEVNFPTIDEKTITPIEVALPDAPTFGEELSAEKPTISDPDNATGPAESVPDKLTSIGGHNVPSPPSIVIADFGEEIPAYTYTVPSLVFNYVEPIYQSDLKDALEAKLQADLASGGSGLASDVEDAIWERTRERDDRDYEDARDKVNSNWAGKNFSLPDGVLVENQHDLIVDDRNQRIERSRDILIKQAELAQVNTHFTITSSLSLEQLELNHANEVNNRALEAEKTVIEFGISYHNLKVADYNIQLERYKAQVVAHAAKLEGERLRLEAYKTELLEVETKSSLDKDLLAEYNLDLERYDKMLRLFTAEQGAVNTALAIEGMKIELYKENINDHRARISAQNNQAELYKAQVEGELGKVRVYEAELKAEQTRIGTLKVQVDAEVAKLNGNIKLQELDLSTFLGNIDRYKAEIGIASIQLSQEGAMYGHDVDKFRAEVTRDAAQLEIGVETLIKGRALDLQNTEIRLENAKANMQALLSTANLRVEAAKGISGSYVALASAVMSGFSAIASIESGGLSQQTEEISP